MGHLEHISGPQDLRGLDDRALAELGSEIRDELIRTCSPRGGHLGPNLGVVELTIAIHRVFESPRDRVIFDTGHQAYVHKMLTGRAAKFDTLRSEGGLSGYPSQSESDHDIVENSHASTSLSYADGLAKAYAIRGEDRHVVAVIGDGALTGGMAWEALNNIAEARSNKPGERRLVMIVNDNGRSYMPTVGGLANHLTTLRTSPRYEQILDVIKRRLNGVRGVGPAVYDALHAMKKGMKDALAPQGLFEDLGLKYVGPVDGHDRAAVEQALTQAKRFGGPVIVHVMTRKGFGYDPAERHEADQFHQIGPFDVETGVGTPKGRIWTDFFAEEMVALGAERQDIVATTAAMLYPVGLDRFAAAYPDRTFDVGIAEQHAATSAAGLAMGGMHPVVAIYATFLNRAFDQVLMDVALHRCGVTFVLDRAGVTGDDGASHNGMWDMSILQVVPGLRLCAPRDGARVAELLRECVAVDDAPTVLRIPKGPPPADIEAVDKAGGMDVLVRDGARDVLILGIGSMASVSVEVAGRLADQGIGVTVVDPRWVKPWDRAVVDLARDHRLVVCVEDNGRVGGCGSTLLQLLTDERVETPFRHYGIPQEFLDHAKRDAILERIGLTAQALARGIVEDVTALDPADDSERPSVRPARRTDRRDPGRPRCGGLTGPDTGPAAWSPSRPPSRCSAPLSSGAATTAESDGPVGQGESTEVTAPQARKQEQRILNQRARAVREGNIDLFLRRVDHSDKALMARQRRYFRNLVQLPLAKLRFRVTDEQWQGLRMPKRWGAEVHVPRVRQVMQLEEYDAVPVERIVGLVFSFRKGRARIVSDRTATGKLLFEGTPAPWDLTSVTVREEPGVLAVFDRETSASAETVTTVVRDGIDEIDRALPFSWSGSVVVYSVQSPKRAGVVHRRAGGRARAPRCTHLPDVRRERGPAGGLDADAGDAQLGGGRPAVPRPDHPPRAEPHRGRGP